MKKKILITMSSLFIGGAERSLIGLLESFDMNKVDVSLFLYRHEGEFLKYIPSSVNLLPQIAAYTTFDRPIVTLIKEGKLFFASARILSKINQSLYCLLHKEKTSTYKTMQYTSKFIVPLLPPIDGEYDLAINYLGIHDVLVKKISAKKKAGWLHTDYSTLKPVLKRDEEMWANLDYIINVSDECTNIFKKIHPNLADKCITIENILSPEFIKSQAKEKCETGIEVSNEILKLGSVGRFSHAKNFDGAVDICSELVELGLNFKWYIIGYGSDEQLIKNRIRESNMENHFIILGKKDNPYPYMNACDIYVQPSRYEGKAVTVMEAQILGKPVIITKFATSGDQLKDGFDGIIVPMDIKKCAKGIFKLARDKDKQKELSDNCLMSDYSNKSEVKKIYQMAGVDDE